MAMLDDCPGLCAEVYVDNTPLEEYTEDTEPETANMTTVYIRSKIGKQFAIRYSVGRPFSSRKDILAKVFLDGKWVCIEPREGTRNPALPQHQNRQLTVQNWNQELPAAL
jgi:hypothetical protein